MKDIVNKGNLSEEDALKSNKVMLWGLNKIPSKLMKKYEAEYKPTKRVYTKKEKADNEKAETKSPYKVYDPSFEDYTYEDLPFLEKEYDRFSNIADISDEDMDAQDKLYDLMEQLEAVAAFNKKTGSGLNEDILKHLVGHIVDKKEPIDKTDVKQAKRLIDKIEKTRISMKGGRFEKGSPEAKEWAEKLRLAKAAKREAEGKPPPKGKYVKKVKPLKPYYNIGEIPSGHREATAGEALENDKVSFYGKYAIDDKTLKDFKTVGFIFSNDIDETQTKALISRMITRMKASIRDIPWVNNRLENIDMKGKDSRYYKDKHEIEEEGMKLKAKYKGASKMIDVLEKHLSGLIGKDIKIVKPKPEVVKPEEIREMKVSDKTPEIIKPENKDFRIPKVPKTPETKRTQLMDTFTYMDKTGKKADIQTKVNIHKKDMKPKLKEAIKENLIESFEREIKGIGFKNSSSNNRYIEMPRKIHLESDSDSDSDIMEHIDKLDRKLRRRGIGGGKIGDAFKKLGHAIKSGASDVAKFSSTKLPSALIHEVLPSAIGITAGLAGDALGGPMGGIVAGEAGSRLGEMAANKIGNKTGYGVADRRYNKTPSESPPKRRGCGFKKGSPEAKAWGAKMREARNRN